MEQIVVGIISFLLGLGSHVGLCAQPGADIEDPSIEVAIPIQLGANPPSCPIGG